MVFLPEAVDYIASTKEKSMSMAEPLTGQTVSSYAELAKGHQIWISLGGIHQSVSGTVKLLMEKVGLILMV